MANKTLGAAQAYARRIARIHAELGIPGDYAERWGLPLHMEPDTLADAGEDMFGRPQRMTPETLLAWQQMSQEADTQGVELLLVSAFRSVDYQADLIRRKLDDGRSLADILSVNAAPGFSEHHTGRALDLSTPGTAVLETDFENSRAFAWLQQNAGRFGFVLSYPRNSPSAITYEPWHWCFQPDQTMLR